MKILQSIDLISRLHGGGVVNISYHLSQSLALRGHDTTIYTSDFKIDQEDIDCLQGVKVYSFQSWLNILGLHITPGLVMEIKKSLSQFDIVHIHQYRSFQNVIIHHYAIKYGVPYLISAHGSLTTYFYRKWIKRIFDMLWGYKILKDASRVLALSPVEVEQYKSMGVNEDKISIIPNGIDISEIDSVPEKGEFRKKYGLNSEQKIILYLGRIHKIKGLDLLANAFVDISKTLKNTILVITGPDGGYLSTLMNLVDNLGINDKVLFTGPLHDRDKFDAYADADVYVLPSIYEAFPVTVLEAFACGTPVVVTDRCGIADIIDNKAGLVVPYNENSLSEALLRILTDEDMRTRFGETGRALVREKYSWSRIIEQMENLYEEVVIAVGE